MTGLTKFNNSFWEWVDNFSGDSERYRRFFLRLTATLLIVVIGPTMAWYTLELNGILCYLGFNVVAKLAASSFAKKKIQIANWVYRYAAIFLLLASVANALVSLYESQIPILYSNIYFIIISPVLLGVYEGSYWSSYWGVKNAKAERKIIKKLHSRGNLTDKQALLFKKSPMRLDYDEKIKKIADPEYSDIRLEKPDESTKDFQKHEVFATVIICIFIFIGADLSPNSWDTLSNILAFILATIALILPLNNDYKDSNNILLRKDRAPSKDSNKPRSRARTISGLFAIMQLSVNYAMKIFALNHGGVSELVIYLAIAELSGFIIADVLPKMSNWIEQFFSVDAKIWRWGHIFSLLGIIGMALGSIINSTTIFILGWFISQGSIRGMMRGREVFFANQYLLCDGYNLVEEIGLRERFKFFMHLQYVIVILICYKLYTYIGYPAESWVVAIMLFWGAVCALLEILFTFPTICGRSDFYLIRQKPQQLVTRQQDQYMD